jgi:hypothetical protein
LFLLIRGASLARVVSFTTAATALTILNGNNSITDVAPPLIRQLASFEPGRLTRLETSQGNEALNWLPC